MSDFEQQDPRENYDKYSGVRPFEGFSLIELSIVILIIGLIVASVIGGKKLVILSNLSKARALTNSSPVNGIENLGLWLETTSKDSYNSLPVNGGTVSVWRDINSQSPSKKNAAAVSAATYVDNGLNGLPVLRFNGTSNYYTFDSTFLDNTDYTIFVVEQRRSDGGGDVNYFISGGDGSSNGTLHLGYRDNTTLTHAQFGNDYDIIIDAYSKPIPRLHVYNQSSVNGKKYYINGELKGSSANTTPLNSNYTTGTIGAYWSLDLFYNGDLAEIIMFNRDLSDFERLEVEKYLSKKWSIKLA